MSYKTIKSKQKYRNETVCMYVCMYAVVAVAAAAIIVIVLLLLLCNYWDVSLRRFVAFVLFERCVCVGVCSCVWKIKQKKGMKRNKKKGRIRVCGRGKRTRNNKKSI